MFFIKIPKICERWPILPKENSYFLQGRPPINYVITRIIKVAINGSVVSMVVCDAEAAGSILGDVMITTAEQLASLPQETRYKKYGAGVSHPPECEENVISYWKIDQ